jgi:hypothetical protein
MKLALYMTDHTGTVYFPEYFVLAISYNSLILFAPFKGSGSAPDSSLSEAGKTHPICSSLSFVLSHIGLTDYAEQQTIRQSKKIIRKV